MSTGPGKYDDVCTVARLATQANAVLLIVLGGNQGSGFSVQCRDQQLLLQLPDMLERLAGAIRADLGGVTAVDERERAARIVEDLMPKNERSDWTEWARIRAEVLTEAAARIRDKRIAGAALDRTNELRDLIVQLRGAVGHPDNVALADRALALLDGVAPVDGGSGNG